MNGVVRAVATLAMVLAVNRVAASPRDSTSETARLDSIVHRFEPRRFAGAVLVVRGDRVLLDRAYGLADRERGVANTVGTRFAIGSLTKQFTAAAIMLLAERGTLRTDDPVTRWIPEGSPGLDSVTLRQLLSHTGGVPDVQDPEVLGPADAPGSPGELAARWCAHRPLEFAPGTRYAYSNTDYILLGRVIEVASGMRYEDFIRARILEPLALNDTGFDDAPGSASAAPRARGYWGRRDSVMPAPEEDSRRLAAAGGLVSTTHDLLRWQTALLGGSWLSPASVAAMTTAVLGDYAYGIHHRVGSGREAFYHSGRIGGFESLLGDYPADRLAIVVLANLDTGAAATLFNEIATAAFVTAAPAR